VIVYEGAVWCDPCRRLHRAVEGGQLDGTFPGLTLVEFDADRDGERLLNAGYSSTYIPLLALPKSDGTASGRQIEGGIKGDGAVEYVKGKLREMLTP
jgi:hypothetical protein